MSSSNKLKSRFGQLAIGPPGSGKTTYCAGMQQLLSAVGRKCCVVNLDPANDTIPYECDINIKDLITVEDAAKHLNLGPNGALLYCMEYLETNKDWLLEQLMQDADKRYYIFDCPGQIELYTHHKSLANVLQWIAGKQVDIKLTAVHLVDSTYCSDANRFISVLMTSLATMMHMELPHVNLLSKMDLAEKYGDFDFNLEFYTDVLDLQKLMDCIPSNSFNKKYKKLNQRISEVVQEYSLVSFLPVQVEDKESMVTVLNHVDRANGYNLGGLPEERNIQRLLSVAAGADFQFNRVMTVQDKYLPRKNEEEKI